MPPISSTVSVETALADFDSVLERVTNGKEVILTRSNVAVVRLVPPAAHKRLAPQFGTAVGKVQIADDFDDPPQDFADYS